MKTQFVLSSYGNGYALGGEPEDVQTLVNLLHNYTGFEGSAHTIFTPTPKQMENGARPFAYFIGSRAMIVEAFAIQARVAARGPILSPNRNVDFRNIDAEAEQAFEQLKREYFMRENERESVFGFTESQPASETDEDPALESFNEGLNRAQAETQLAHV